jgi:hypothetical protein
VAYGRALWGREFTGGGAARIVLEKGKPHRPGYAWRMASMVRSFHLGELVAG